MSRAADGSLRDALSLTDQAIASGEGQLTAASVSTMLGTLDDDQALSLIEALVAADGERVMAGVNDAAARGVEWEALLVEMQSLLHRIAMVQLSPSALGADMAAVEVRMRELARTVPPGDVQLYYQTLLIGRKELPYAPDRRMGVEMTLLRALAFHPRKPLPEPEVQPAQAAAPAPRQPVAPPRRRHSRRRVCRRPPAGAGGPQPPAAQSGSNHPKRVNRQPLPRAAGE